MIAVMTAQGPDKRLRSIIEGLTPETDRFVIAFDPSSDGSGPFFDALSSEYGDALSLLPVSPFSRGKALKAAFRHILSQEGGADSVLTLSAGLCDPLPAVMDVISAMREEPGSLILGSLHGPDSKKAGTRIARSVFAITSGVRIYDIRTGLRAFPGSLLEEFSGLSGSLYDHEAAQLLYAVKTHIPVREVHYSCGISDDERCPGYRTFADQWLVYRTIFAFMLSSFGSFLIDYVSFLGVRAALGALPSAVAVDSTTSLLPVFGMELDTKLLALIAGRIIGTSCNFLFNRNLVFKSAGRASIAKYYLLQAMLLSANYLMLTLINTEGGLPAWLAQPVIQTVLYPINFVLQRKWVFREGSVRGKVM